MDDWVDVTRLDQVVGRPRAQCS